MRIVRFLDSLDLIRYGRNLYITQRIERYLHDSRIEAPRRYQMDTVDAVIAMVDAGLGWTISTPLGFLKGAGGARNVRCLPLPGKPMVRRLNLLARREGGLTVASRYLAATEHYELSHASVVSLARQGAAMT